MFLRWMKTLARYFSTKTKKSDSMVLLQTHLAPAAKQLYCVQHATLYENKEGLCWQQPDVPRMDDEIEKIVLDENQEV